ncbi:MAG TPA: hypothetical protein DHV62_03260 [Elusimicrobia bacterium]|jgi:TRAP-type uncharacterized transport system fused permease subunit|nr:hypothetical protein [Elusimicrobiota bacterium]
MKAIAIICVILAVIGIVLGIIARVGPGVIAGQGARTLGAGSGLFLLLAIALLLLEQKKQ